MGKPPSNHTMSIEPGKAGEILVKGHWIANTSSNTELSNYGFVQRGANDEHCEIWSPKLLKWIPAFLMCIKPGYIWQALDQKTMLPRPGFCFLCETPPVESKPFGSGFGFRSSQDNTISMGVNKVLEAPELEVLRQPSRIAMADNLRPEVKKALIYTPGSIDDVEFKDIE